MSDFAASVIPTDANWGPTTEAANRAEEFVRREHRQATLTTSGTRPRRERPTIRVDIHIQHGGAPWLDCDRSTRLRWPRPF